MLEHQITETQINQRRWPKKALILVAIVLLLENIILAFNNLQNKTAILGLKFNNHLLLGLTRNGIEQLVKIEAGKANRPLKFNYQNQEIEIKPEDIGAKVDPTEITNLLLQKGRDGNIWQKILYQNEALLGVKNRPLIGNLSQTLLSLRFLQIQDQINIDPTPLRPDFEHDINKTLPAQDGIKVDTSKLTVLVSDNISSPPLSPLTLPVIRTFTTHKESELDPIRKQASELTKASLSITSGGLTFTLTPADLKGLLTVVERPNPKDPKKLVLLLRLDDKKLNQKLGEFAARVESITHAEFDDHDARVAIYSLFYSNQRKTLVIPTGRLLASNVLAAETETGEKLVYLTFDDGPNSIYHPLILDILKKYDVKATFFLVGKNAQADQEIAKRTAAEGHAIGNHSLTHSFLPNLANLSALKEIQTTEEILKPINLGQEVKLFRPPYGGVNLAVKKNATDLGLKLFLWDVDPRDWSEPTTDDLVNRVVSNTHNGSDILLHSNHLATVRALSRIIEILKSKGYNFEVLN